MGSNDSICSFRWENRQRRGSTGTARRGFSHYHLLNLAIAPMPTIGFLGGQATGNFRSTWSTLFTVQPICATRMMRHLLWFEQIRFESRVEREESYGSPDAGSREWANMSSEEPAQLALARSAFSSLPPIVSMHAKFFNVQVSDYLRYPTCALPCGGHLREQGCVFLWAVFCQRVVQENVSQLCVAFPVRPLFCRIFAAQSVMKCWPAWALTVEAALRVAQFATVFNLLQKTKR